MFQLIVKQGNGRSCHGQPVLTEGDAVELAKAALRCNPQVESVTGWRRVFTVQPKVDVDITRP